MKKTADTDRILNDTRKRAIHRNSTHILLLVATSIVVFLLMIIAFFIFYNQTNRLLQQQSSFYLQETATKSAERLKEKVDGDLKLLEGLALVLEQNESLDVTQMINVMKDSPLFSEFQRIGFMLPDGSIYTQELEAEGFSSRQYFQEVMKGNVTISDVFIDKIHQQSTIAYGVPLIHNNKVIGAIGVGLVLKEYEEVLDYSSFRGDGTVHLLDSSGSIIFKVGKANIPKRLSLDTLKEDFKEGKSGIIRLEGQGNPRLLAYAPVGVKDWILLLEIPNTFLLKTQRQTALYAFMLTLGYGVLMLSFIYYILFRRRKYDNSLLKIAYFDELTDLPNYHLIVESAEALVSEYPSKYACVMLNIRNFKIIKDLYGYAYGDVLIKQVASMLPQFCTDKELYGRLERDRFLLFLHKEDIEKRVGDILRILNQLSLPTTASFKLEIVAGIYCITDARIPIPICIDRASLAVNHLHDNHETPYLIYTDTIKKFLLHESEMVKDFQKALELEQFFVMLQPKYNLITETIVGAEALVRWAHPTRGLLPPFEFIQIFEKHNLITILDMFVLHMM